MIDVNSHPARRPRPGRRRPAWLATGLLSLLLAACEPPVDEAGGADKRFQRTGTVESALLDEISGLQASHRHPGVLWTHNDDGRPRVHAIGTDGADLGYFDIEDAVNTDWEDMTRIPGRDGRDLLVLADVGDNRQRRSRVWLYLVEEPDPGPDGRFSGVVNWLHWISIAYPDGPRDTESIAWDASGRQLLLLSKRQRPPVLYALDADTLFTAREATVERLGEVSSLRPPSPADRRYFGDRIDWISQPTAFDISPDGRRAAVLTYRSLYLFERGDGQDWLEALNGQPLEIIGPPVITDEAVSYDADGVTVWVGAEGEKAPLYEFRLVRD